MLTEGDFAFLADLVRRHSGNVLAEERRASAAVQLTRFAARREQTVQTLLGQLRQGFDSELAVRAAQALVNGETSFFRDPALFEYLRDAVFPGLIAARTSVRRLRVWSAACGTGQEIYSVLMLLEDFFPLLSTWDLDLFASDLSEARLTQARQGLYSAHEVSRGLSVDYLDRFFTRESEGWRVRPELRSRVRFSQVDLTKDWPPTGIFDLVMARNVLMYFDDQVRRDILHRIRGNLAPDGILALGGLETAGEDGFRQAAARVGGCYIPR